MPRIPTLEAQGGPAGAGLPLPQPATNVLAGALNELEDQLRQRRAALQLEADRQARARDSLWVTETTAAAQRDWLKRYQETQTGLKVGETAGFADRFWGEFDQWRQTALGGAPSEEARLAAQQRLAIMGQSFYESAAAFEQQSLYGEHTQQFGQAYDALRQAVGDGMDPAKALAQLNSDLSIADGQWMQGPDVEAWRRKAPGELAQASIDGLVLRDPAAALAKLGAAPVAGPPGGDIVGAMIQAESGGNPSAVSNKGAVGLMQVLPATAREVLASMGERELARMPEDRLVAMLKDPAQNRRIGEAYLAQMLQRYQGNAALALAAYNAGPANVDKWLGTIGDPNGGGITNAQWVDKIPFSETRRYVESLLATGRPANPGGSDTEQAAADPVVAMLAPDQRQRAIDQAQRQLTERRSVLAAQLEGRLKDEEAAAGAGQPIANPVTLPDLVAAYGPAQGLKTWGELQTVRQLGRDLASISLMPPAQQQALLERYKPEGDGFAGELARYEAMARAIEQDRKARADPAAYVYVASPELQRLYAEPAKLEQATTASLALQERAGIPETERRALSSGQAQALADELTKSKPEQILPKLDQVAASYGKQWPRVAGELVKAGLPSPLTALVALDNDLVFRAEAVAAQVAGGKTALENSLKKEDIKTIDAEIETQLAPWLKTMPPGAAQPYIDAARLVALSLARKMDDPGSAAERAAAAILSRYHLAGDYRIPVRFDPRKVETGLGTYLAQLDRIDPLGGGDPNLTDADRMSQQLNSLKHGFRHWFTSGDESGVVLLDQNWQPVLRDGKPVTVTWAEAEALGRYNLDGLQRRPK